MANLSTQVLAVVIVVAFVVVAVMRRRWFGH